MTYFPTVMALYSLLVLKVPLNSKQISVLYLTLSREPNLEGCWKLKFGRKEACTDLKTDRESLIRTTTMAIYGAFTGQLW